MEKIKLFKKRNFGDTIGTAFDLLRQNIRLISKSFLIFVMPFLVFSLLSFALGVIGLFKVNSPFGRSGRAATVAYVISLSIGYVGYFLTFFIEAVVLHIVIIAYENSDDPATLTISHVWKLIKANIGRIIAAFFSLWLYLVVFGFIAFIIYYVGAEISTSSAGLAILIIYLAAIYLQISLSTYLMLILRSHSNAMAALSHSLSLTAGRWWRTFGITLVMGLIALSFYSVCLWPFSVAIYLYVTHMVATMGDNQKLPFIYTLMGIGLVYGGVVLGYFGNLVVLGHTVNYYSLMEDKEHIGLESDIQHIGMHEPGIKIQEGDY